LSRKPIIGLAGGIGSGKSTVARLLAECGAAVIDSDALNHEVLQSPEVVQTLVSWWGETVLSASEGGPEKETGGEPGEAAGSVDRQKISDIIFRDPRQRRRLEKLVHPRIARRREGLIAAHQQDPDIRAIILDSPLLIESGLDRRCDLTLFVDAPDGMRRRRVTTDRGWSEQEWLDREKSQLPLDKKRARADHIIVNNSSDLAQLRKTVRDLFSILLERFANDKK